MMFIEKNHWCVFSIYIYEVNYLVSYEEYQLLYQIK